MVKIHGKITKLDEAENLVFGWASIIKDKAGNEIVDFQGDVISEVELEKMAYRFVLKSRKAGEMHDVIGVGNLVESIVFTKEKMLALGLNDGALPTGWWVGFKVDPSIFEKVKSGEYQMFSIGGDGVREERT